MTTPEVSVVIATRERPEKLARLLACVQQQDFANFECIVVDDASSPETSAKYPEIFKSLDERFRLHLREKSGGPSLGRNTGIRLARGKFIAFCDDDDYWTRPDHLSVAVGALNASGAEFFFADMQTSVHQKISNPSWYARLKTATRKAPVVGASDVFPLERTELAGFLNHAILHANTLVIAKPLLERIGLYWEKISFAEDHNLSLKLADTAKGIIFRPTVTADLDVSPHPSIARTFSESERKVFSLAAIFQAQMTLDDPALRKVCRANRAWRLLEISEALQEQGRIEAAREFALEALCIRFSKRAVLTWLGLLWRRKPCKRQQPA